MTTPLNTELILRFLDLDRIGDADPTLNGGIVRDFAPGTHDCTIIYSRCDAADIPEIIRREIALADESGYDLEWKFYGHDQPSNLEELLLSAGFEAEPVEQWMVLPVTAETVELVERTVPADAPCTIRRVETIEHLDDLAITAAATGQCDPAMEKVRLGATMREMPESMSIYLAYDSAQPVSAGRIHYTPSGNFGGLYGGRTIPGYRNRGCYTAVVAARLREALERNVPYVFVDAAPTSEPILRKRGFQNVTYTRPYIYRPSSVDSK